MALAVNVTPGKQFALGESVTYAGLNLLGQPTFAVTGTIATGDVSDGAITAAKSKPGAHWYASGSLSGSTYTLTLNPSLAALANGVTVFMKADTAAVDNALLNVNSLGAKKLFSVAGEPVRAGMIQANQIVALHYSTTLDSGSGGWQITGPSALSALPLSTTGGAAGAYTLTFTQTIAAQSHLDGVMIMAQINHDQSTATATLNVNGLGAVAMALPTGEALPARSLRADQVVALVYEAGTAKFHLLSPPAMEPMLKGVDAGSNDSYAITPVPSPKAYFDGLTVLFKANTANTGAATLNLNALGNVDLKKSKNLALETGDIKAGSYVLAVHDGTNFQLMNQVWSAPAQVWGVFSGVPVSKTISAVNTGTETLTVTGHGITAAASEDTAQAVSIRAATPPTGLLGNTIYYAYVVDANNLKLSTSRTGAVDGTTSIVDITGAGSGTQTVDYCVATAQYGVAGVIARSAGGSLDTGMYDVYWARSFTGGYMVQFTIQTNDATVGEVASIIQADSGAGGFRRFVVYDLSPTPGRVTPLGIHVMAFGN